MSKEHKSQKIMVLVLIALCILMTAILILLLQSEPTVIAPGDYFDQNRGEVLTQRT